MQDRSKRGLEGLLIFAGVLLFIAPAFNLLVWNLAIFAGIACFVALAVLRQYF
jgi:hypothetical protein